MTRELHGFHVDPDPRRLAARAVVERAQLGCEGIDDLEASTSNGRIAHVSKLRCVGAGIMDFARTRCASACTRSQFEAHNTHHAFPSFARHGVDRRQIDLTATCIRLWERLGLVHSVHWPDIRQLALRRIAVPVQAGA